MNNLLKQLALIEMNRQMRGNEYDRENVRVKEDLSYSLHILDSYTPEMVLANRNEDLFAVAKNFPEVTRKLDLNRVYDSMISSEDITFGVEVRAGHYNHGFLGGEKKRSREFIEMIIRRNCHI